MLTYKANVNFQKYDSKGKLSLSMTKI